jgi:hypothetical protein
MYETKVQEDEKNPHAFHPSSIFLIQSSTFSDPANTSLTPQKAMSFSGPSNPLLC